MSTEQNLNTAVNGGSELNVQLCDDCAKKTRPVAWMWEMHGWVVTAHGKHRVIKRFVDTCQPPTCTLESDDFIRLVPLYAGA